LLGDSHAGLGRYEAAIEAYRDAAQGFEADGAPCSRALCLFKIADSYMSLHEPWHALGYLEVCLPILREFGLVRHFSLAQDQLAACRAELARAHLLREGPGGPAALAACGDGAALAACGDGAALAACGDGARPSRSASPSRLAQSSTVTAGHGVNLRYARYRRTAALADR
jgi:tetratricopeptide (TPR) repeat protein